MRERIDEASRRLWSAERGRAPIEPLSEILPDLNEEDGYAIAERTRVRRSRRAIGFKLGFTSAAMREQMGISRPNFGVLTDDLMIPEGDARIDTLNLIHPRVEPEIALLVGRDLGAGQTRASALAATDAVMAAFEIVDTRYRSYRFSAADNIADNSSAARFVVGSPVLPGAVEDLRLCGVLLWSGGEMVDQGVGANALGDPLLSLCWLADMLAQRGAGIAAGSIVLTGGLTKSHAARAGSCFMAEFGGLGSVVASF